MPFATISGGRVTNAYDNARMETINGLCAAECIRTAVVHGGPHKTIADVEYATASWVDCYNQRRGHSANGGDTFPQSESFSFQIATDSQAETDRYWDAIVGNGGQESACGWCKDRWGVSWQITPRVLSEAIASEDPGVAERAFAAMNTMCRIDVAEIEHAVAGS